ncbi:MAG TPA: TolC family protein [Polyangia bacterium]|jgi:outer membrane protein
MLAVALVLAQAKVLTLSDALHSALRAQPTIAAADANTRAAAARVGEARAPLLPQLAAGGKWSFGDDPTTPGWSLGLTATQTVWDGSGQLARLGASRALVDAAAATAQSTRLQLALTVEQQYFAACATRALADVAKESVDNQDQHLQQIEGFVRAGTRPEIDLAQARSDRANAEVQLIAARNNYALAKAQLAQSMGGDAGEFDVADATLDAVAGEDAPVDALLDEALRARPELAAAAAQLRAQGFTIAAAKDTFGPTLALSAGATESGAWGGSPGATWSVGAKLDWSLFSGGLSYYGVKEAEATRDALTATRAALVLQVRFQIVQAQLGVHANEAALAAAATALENTREQLRLAEGRYAAGIGSVIELGDAQIAYANAGAQSVQARYNVASARAALLEAVGRGPTV